MRHIFIGDIHGCYDELRRLLDAVAPRNGDVVVSTGDMVRKGPQPDRCLDLWLERGYLAVLGNQEEKLLDLVAKGTAREEGDRRVAERLDLIAYLRRLPLFLDFADARIAAVHGGVLPETSFSRGKVEASTTLRYVRQDGERWIPVPKSEQRERDRFWSEVWDGDRTVLYGHTPRREVRRDRKAIGIDTGCVYGGALTAAIFENGRWRFESVPAARRYASRSLFARLRKWFRSMHD